MAMEIASNYNSYTSQYPAVNGSGSRQESKAEYLNELAKLVPSVECRIGNAFSSSKSGKTLTINPFLLEKMQNDPQKEKEIKELIKGVESAVNSLDRVMNASGWNVVFKNDYIDENGKYHQVCLVRNDYMLNMSKELREERRKNSEKLMEKIKEKATKRKENLKEKLDENQIKKEDGMIYLKDQDIETIIEAATEDHTIRFDAKEQKQAGGNLDLKV